MSLPLLSLVRRSLSGRFPEAESLLEFVRQEIFPVLKELRAAFNSLAGPTYNFGTLLYGDGVPIDAPFSARATYINKSGGAGAVVYAWNGAAWELLGGGGSLKIDDEGILQGSANEMNFTGAGVVATVAGTVATVTIPGGGGTPATTVVTETAFGQGSAVGASGNYAREDHTHGTPAAPAVVTPATTVVTETAFGQASAVGVGANYAREDHTHGTPAAPAGGTPAVSVQTEQTFSIASAVGVSLNYAREDHTHGSPPIFQTAHDFGAGGVDSITQTVADASITGTSQFVTTVRPAFGRDVDEMELGPVVEAVGNIVNGVSFDVIVAALDGSATGSYVVDVVRHLVP